MVKFSLSIFLVFFLTSLQVTAQVKDTSIKIARDTVKHVVTKNDLYHNVLDSNIFLNIKGKPDALVIALKKHENSNNFFYIFASLFLSLGLLRTIFSRYFTTMFRVFFNTSLRQNQLTDQLEQAAFPSLLFNIFFSVSIGLYIYILYRFHSINGGNINWAYLGFCIIGVAVCYLVKYISLIFIGWITNYASEAKIYIFSIFLLNKIIGMLLLPFMILIAFSTNKIAGYAAISSLILLAVLLLSRFFRIYGLLQNRLKLNGIHFLIYFFSLEILPILIIYKAVALFFGNNS